MLGTGLSLTNSGYIGGATPDGTYTSDFSSSADSWTAYSFTVPSNGTITFGESIGGRDNCLKLLMNGDETSGQPFGIYNTIGVTGEVFEVGDTIEYSYEFYSDDVSPINDDPAGEVNVSIQFGATYHASRRDKRNLDDGVWHTISGTKEITGGTNNDDLLIYFGTAGNNPSTGDSVYFRNIVVNHYKG